MLLYRGQPTARAKQDAAWRLSPWIQDALESDDFKSIVHASGRWFTDDLEIARWYADDASGSSEIVCVEVSDYVAEVFRVSNIRSRLPCGCDPVRFSRDPEREFMLPLQIAARAIPIEAPLKTRLAA